MRPASLLLSILPMTIWGLAVRVLGDVSLYLAHGLLLVSILGGVAVLGALWRMSRPQPATPQPARVLLLDAPEFAAHARRAANDARRRAA
jgi:hypothetical protein